MTRIIRLLAFLAVIIFSGCAHYSLIEPKTYVIADVYSIEPQIAWSSSVRGKSENWTVDGPSLQTILFVKGLEDGESVFPPKGEKEPPKFKSYMKANEVMEFILDSWRYSGVVQVKATNLRPIQFGKAPGYRFEYTYVSKNGLEMEGLAIGAVLHEQLYLIMYEGTRQYYFQKHKLDVEKIIESVNLL